MKTERLKIVNFCQHPFRDESFQEGLTAILGPNGSGKSNFLGAMRLALTGRNPNAGGKTDNVFDRAPREETSYVEMVFSHGEERATVRRNLRPSRPTAKLTLASGEVIEGDEKVSTRIEQILGIDADVINDIVIVGQSEIFGFLDKTPMKRAEQFQRLFHTEKALLVYKVVGDHQRGVEVPAVGVDLDEVRKVISEQESKVATLQPRLDEMPDYSQINEQRDANANVSRVYQQRLTAHAQLGTLRGQRDVLQQQHQADLQRRDEANAALQQVRQLAAQQGTRADEARAALSRLEQHRRLLESRASLNRSLADAQANQAAAVQPQAPEGYIEPKELQQKLDGLQFEIRRLTEFVHSFEGDVAACPTCYTPVAQLAGKLDQAQQQLMNFQALRDSLVEQQRACQEYDRQQQAYRQQQERFAYEISSMQRQLESLPSAVEEAVDEQSLQQVVQEASQTEQSLEQNRQAVQELENVISRAEGTLEVLGNQIAQLEKQLAEIPHYTEEQSNQAAVYVHQWDQLAAERRQVESDLAIASTTLQNATQQLQSAEAVAQQAQKARSWHQRAERIRSVVHKDAAPKFVAQRNLRRLQRTINENLDMFQTNFRVEADDGLSFIAHMTNGSRQKAERLSGGQKVILALSFRIALNLMFAENIGALYLDEPTAYLDEHHIRGLEPVISQLRDFSTARGLQCMIITHEQNLAPLFDTVVQL